MIALTYRMTLEQPLLVPGLVGEPNSATSLPYVPGSQIRGALIGAYLRSVDSGSESYDLLEDEQAQRLFFSGRVRYLNAYPETDSGARMLPTPLSWQTRKRDPGPITDRVNAEADAAREKREAVSQPFCSIADETVELFNPSRRISVHTQRAPKMGRATRQEGAVFRYNALAAGQRFRGLVLIEGTEHRDDDRATIQQLLTAGDLALGKSRSAGYGQVAVDDLEPLSTAVEAGVPPEQMPDEPVSSCIVTLLSDALVRDPCTGQPQADPSAAMEAEMGLEPGTLTLSDRFWETRLVGGFNRKWGVPLPQEPGLAAGSVFRIKCSGGVAPGALQKIVEQGIGERRVEGFGRVAIDWHQQAAYPQWQRARQRIATASPELADEARDVAQDIVNRIYRERLDRVLASVINATQIDRGHLTNSQVGQFRVIARQVLNSGADHMDPTGALDEHLQRALQRQSARQMIESARVKDGISNEWLRLDQWLKRRLTSPADVLNAIEVTSPEIGGVEPSDSAALAQEYAVRLVDGVLYRAVQPSAGAAPSEARSEGGDTG